MDKKEVNHFFLLYTSRRLRYVHENDLSWKVLLGGRLYFEKSFSKSFYLYKLLLRLRGFEENNVNRCKGSQSHQESTVRAVACHV